MLLGMYLKAISCLLYKNIALFCDSVNDLRMWTWWIVGLKNPTKVNAIRIMCRLMIGESSLNEHAYRFNDKKSKTCNHCSTRAVQSVSHLLFDCNNVELALERKKWTSNFMDTLPPMLLKEINSMSSSGKTVFILSGLKSQYLCQWNDIYVVLCDFVYNMYDSHRKLLDSH